MRLRKRLSLVLILSTFLLIPAESAFAQAWLKDRDTKEGTGVRVGDLELHPGIALMGGYDSNPYYRDDLDKSGITASDDDGVVSSAVGQVTPHLDISTISRKRRADSDDTVVPPFIDFRGGLSASAYYFSFTNELVDRFEANVDLRETFNPERPFSVHLSEEYSRRWIPVLGSGAVQNHVAGGIKPEFQTPGGLLRGSLGYKFNYDWFDDARNNNLLHNISQLMSWEFLPKTALFEELTFQAMNFTTNRIDLNTDKNDSYRLTGRAGINGAMTKTIAITVSAGLTNGFIESSDDTKDLVAQVQLRWRPTDTFTLTLSGRRTGENALQGNSLTRTGAGLEAGLIVGGAFSLGAEARVESLSFGNDRTQLGLKDGSTTMLGTGDLDPSQSAIQVDAFSLDPRTDLRVNLNLNAEYRFASWLAVTAEFNYYLNDTNYVFLSELDVDGNMGGDLDPDILRANPAAFEGYRMLAGLRAFL